MSYQNLIKNYSPEINFNEFTGFKRIGAHHITLMPGEQSSNPHSESHEEEFVFVIDGKIDAWIDGWIYPLKTFEAVGFPAGTGINHCFINNSDKPVRILVVGERTKNENKCFFPLHPEKKTEPIWWENAPRRPLGPHNGKPGKVKPEEYGKERPPFIINSLEIPMSDQWSYPGDTEKFGHSFSFSKRMELKNLGINFESLQPGRRSCWPHAHTIEEEFCYILKGHGSVWLNGFTYEVSAGDAIKFPPNTNISHCLISDSAEPLVYIGMGETAEFEGEKIIYPLHPARNEYCKSINWLWENPPKMPMGPHNGISKITSGI
jgi:uncharacterized cupin superfamily protein